jgi:glycosyltransferase involved in cell wall biosynthesis
MRILLVNDYGTSTGGAEIQLLHLRRLLRERGHEARLFTSRARPGGARVEADDTCLGTVAAARTLLQAWNPWAARDLRRALASFRPDVVHVGVFLTQLSPSILPALVDVPALLHVHWYRPVCPSGTKRLPDGRDCEEPWGVACLRHGCLSARAWAPLMVQRRQWRLQRGAFDRFMACGEAVRARLAEAGIANVEVVWNGVPPCAARAPLADPPVAAFAGRLVPEKGVGLLIDAFERVLREVPEGRLVIVGDGPEREAIEGRIDRAGLVGRVDCTGWLTGPALAAALDRAWVQVVPSLWMEPFGLAAAEAMMRGTAVIASSRGGPSELVAHGRSGLLFETGSVDALARTLIAVFRDRGAAEQMGSEARRFALDHLSERAFVERMIQTYAGMIAS